ncbi:MAG: exopolysaccharide biosynthesis GT4 family glycosyltransferase EpsE [Rhodobacterales bacterium]|nr:exopolysaccharide biosynthesis GT4 family glycosyltransferase EpsE [Rhodobacterales bacterium]
MPKPTETPSVTASNAPILGYLIPQFPGQTHIFFWREICAAEDMGTPIALFSTRMPHAGLISHDWSDAAIARTDYLGAIKPLAALRTLLRISPRFWWGELRRSGMDFAKDLAICAAAADRLHRQCHARGIRHVHVHSCGRAALIAALACQLGDLTYSLTLHGPLSDYGSGQYLKWSGASFATIITQRLLIEMDSDLGAALPALIEIQPMGVDTDALKRPAPYEPAVKNTPLRLFTCGRLNIVKGHQDLLHAVCLLVGQGIDVQLDIAGEDDDGGQGYHQTLAALLTDLDLQNHVRLLGAISNDAVRDHLLRAHIFVLASWHEPLGVAYMEAMSCGVPTIGTNAGGVPELINDGIDGILVAPKDPDALAAAITSIVTSPDKARALGVAGRARIVSGFDSRVGAQTILSLTRQIDRL